MRIPFKGVPGNVQRAAVNVTGTGNTAIVAAPGALKRVRVLAVWYTTNIANTVKWQSATTDITAALVFAAGGGIVLPYNEQGWFECAINEALNFNQVAAGTIGVNVLYCITT